MEKSQTSVGMSVWLTTTNSIEMKIEELFDKNCRCTWFDKEQKYQSQNFSYAILTDIRPNSGLFYTVETVL